VLRGCCDTSRHPDILVDKIRRELWYRERERKIETDRDLNAVRKHPLPANDLVRRS
jgi:hypothetical protein